MKLQIIIGSTRPQRVSPLLAKWVEKEANNIEGIDVEVVDLIDYNMPLFNEPISPQYNPDRKLNPVVGKFLDKLSKADAFVIVTPEYNRSYPAVLKNALDYVDFQMKEKPVALVAHGSTGGSQAISHLRGVFPGLLAITVPRALFFIGQVGKSIDEQGNLEEGLKSNPYGPHTALTQVLAETKWYSDALAAARSKK